MTYTKDAITTMCEEEKKKKKQGYLPTYLTYPRRLSLMLSERTYEANFGDSVISVNKMSGSIGTKV